jgi:hypothetical protein
LAKELARVPDLCVKRGGFNITAPFPFDALSEPVRQLLELRFEWKVIYLKA